MAATYSPVVQQNATWEIQITITRPQPDPSLPALPFDLTTFTGQSQIKASYDAGAAVLASPVVTIVDPVNGKLKIFLSIAQTAALQATSIKTPPNPPLPVWDVLIANTDKSQAYSILSGNVTVKPGVTHWTP
jgi:uncharacterized protein involved in outer membrane biogenesis